MNNPPFRHLAFCEILLIFLLTSCGTAPPVSTLELDARLKEAVVTASAEGPAPALPKLEALLEAYREAGAVKGEAITLGHLGTCYKNLGKFEKAIEFHTEALAKKRLLNLEIEVAKTLNGLGLAYWELGDYELAAARFEEGLAIARSLKDRRIEAAVINNLALVYDEWGEYRRSLEAYHSALEMERAEGDRKSESYTLGNIGGVHLLLGHFQTALEYYLQALDLSRELGSLPSETVDLGNLALCYLELGQTEKALEVLNEALSLAMETGQLKDQAYWHSGKGSALARLGRYDEALTEYERAFEIHQTGQAKREIVETLAQIGTVALSLGDVAGAEKRFEEALAIARKVGHQREITNGLVTLGQSAQVSGRLERAEQFFEEALQFSLEVGDRANETTSLLYLASVQLEREELPDALKSASRAARIAHDSGSLPREIMALKLQGDAELGLGSAEIALRHYDAAARIARTMGDPEVDWQIGHARGLALSDLGRNSEAIRVFRRAVEIIEISRFQLETRRHRAGFLDQRYQPYNDLIHLLVEEGEAEQALYFAERLRGSVLLDHIEDESLVELESQAPGIFQLRGQIRHLRSLIRTERQKTRAHQRVQALAVYEAELDDAETAYQRSLGTPKQGVPEWAGTDIPRLPTIREIRRRIPEKTALLEFLQTEEELFVFVLDRGTVSAIRIDAGEQEIGTRVEIFLEMLSQRTGEAWKGPSQGLYRLLIQPVVEKGLLDGVRHLYLVPHSNLHYVPFAALARPGQDGLRFLLDDFDLSYLPSASLLAGSRSSASPSQELLAFAPRRAALEFVDEELERVAAEYPDRSVILRGNEALESEFYRLAPHYRIIHLATHARFDKLNPLHSALDLESSEAHDGSLEVWEIMGLQIRADLVTLSACETALGGGFFSAVPPGDDFVGLTRAFLAAGSRSVLASLWRVNDRSTLELMTRFYSEWNKQAPAVALGEAQRRVRALGKSFEHPYHWAAFVLVQGSGFESF